MSKTILFNTEEIQNYIKDIRKIKVISHERQDEIFKLLSKSDITKSEKQALHNELVLGNLRFVITISKSYQNSGMDLIDIISEGNIGLMRAAERFNPNSGFKFISYAVWWIKQSIMASLNENSRTIRIPSNLVQESQKQRKNEKIDEDKFFFDQDEPSLPSNLPYCIGLSREINEDGDQLIDVIPNKNVESPDAILNTPEEIKRKVHYMLSVLDEREKTIIEKYYGLTGI
jgi:RNA polymerase primary sigma factor